MQEIEIRTVINHITILSAVNYISFKLYLILYVMLISIFVYNRENRLVLLWIDDYYWLYYYIILKLHGKYVPAQFMLSIENKAKIFAIWRFEQIKHKIFRMIDIINIRGYLYHITSNLLCFTSTFLQMLRHNFSICIIHCKYSCMAFVS